MQSGDELELAAGLYTASCNLTISSPHVNIFGAGTAAGSIRTVLDCSSFKSRIFLVTSFNVSLSNLHFRNGSAPCPENETLPCEGSEYDGGCVHATGSSFSVLRSKFSSCFSARYGGGFSALGKVVVESVTFDGCHAQSGGAIHSGENTIIRNSIFLRNSATMNGGAVYASAGASVVVGQGAEFIDNAADYGGAFFSLSSHITLTGNVLMQNNTAATAGGAICMDGGELLISGAASIRGNAAMGRTGGGGVAGLSGAAVWVKDGVAIEHNDAVSGAGGGVYISDANLTLSGLVRIRNNAAGDGGG
eukprot:3931868-Rhodomonas_salina.1